MATHTQSFRFGLGLTGEFSPYVLGTNSDSISYAETRVGNSNQPTQDSVGYVETGHGGLFMQGVDDDISFYEVIESLSVRGPITLYLSDPRFFGPEQNVIQPPPERDQTFFNKPKHGGRRVYPRRHLAPTFSPYGIQKSGTTTWHTVASAACGIDGSNDYTVAMWFWASATSSAQRLYNTFNASNRGLEILLSAAGSLIVQTADGAATSQLATNAGIAASTWILVVSSWLRSASVNVLWINGTLIGTKSYSAVTGNIFADNDIYFGRRSESITPSFNGIFGETVIWRESFTSTQITSWFDYGLDRFDEAVCALRWTNAKAMPKDFSGSRNNATLVGLDKYNQWSVADAYVALPYKRKMA